MLCCFYSCCCCCCLPAPQADLTRFRRVIIRWVSPAKERQGRTLISGVPTASKRIDPLKITLPLNLSIEESKKRYWRSMSVHSLRNSVHNTFSTIHLFRDCFARFYKYSLNQRERDTLAVRIVRWATIIRPTRVLSNDLWTRKPRTHYEGHCFHQRVIVRWVSTAKRKLDKAAHWFPESPPLEANKCTEKTLPTQFLRRIEGEMLKVHVSSDDNSPKSS